MKKKVEGFNKYFKKVEKNTFEKTRSILLGEKETAYFEPDVPYMATEFLNHQPVGVNCVKLTSKEMNNTNSVGSDNTQLKFIKDLLHAIASYLTCIIKISRVTGECPSLWQHAIVVPLFESGDEDSVYNYRPISLLSILSEVIEKVISKQLMSYLETRNLSNSQHGFRARLSTEAALTFITNEIYHSMDNRKISVLTPRDLSKAYDSVNHIILVNKYLKLKIHSFWCSSYLRDGPQSVRIRDIYQVNVM